MLFVTQKLGKLKIDHCKYVFKNMREILTRVSKSENQLDGKVPVVMFSMAWSIIDWSMDKMGFWPDLTEQIIFRK